MKERKTILVCDNCGAEGATWADFGFGFRCNLQIGDTHICDRFEYGRLKRKGLPNTAAATDSQRLTMEEGKR